MENNFFQLNRFLNLTKREFYKLSHSKYLILSIVGGLSLLMVLINAKIDFSNFYVGERTDDYIGVTKFIFILSPLFFYRNINHQQKGLIDALLPASTFEKFLKMQLFCFIIIPLIFLSLFAISDMIFSLILGTNEAFYLVIIEIFKSFNSISGNGLWKILFYSQLFFLLNLFTRSHKILQIIGFLIFALLIVVLIIIAFSYVFFSSGDEIIDFIVESSFNVDFNNSIWNIIINILKILFNYLIIVAMAVGSYFKLKSLRY